MECQIACEGCKPCAWWAFLSTWTQSNRAGALSRAGSPSAWSRQVGSQSDAPVFSTYTTLYYITLHSSRHHEYNCNYTIRITLHHNYNSTTLQLQLQLHYTTPHLAVVGEVTTATIATTPKKTQLQPPSGPSVDSICHPCITTANLSCRFLFLKLPPPPCAVLLVYIYIHIYMCVCLCLHAYIPTCIANDMETSSAAAHVRHGPPFGWDLKALIVIGWKISAKPHTFDGERNMISSSGLRFFPSIQWSKMIWTKVIAKIYAITARCKLLRQGLSQTITSDKSIGPMGPRSPHPWPN